MKRLSNQKWVILGLAFATLATGAYVALASPLEPEPTVMTLQCVDSAAQETTFYQDGVMGSEHVVDVWTLQTADKVVVYVQPTGEVCTYQKSVMALENATGKVD